MATTIITTPVVVMKEKKTVRFQVPPDNTSTADHHHQDSSKVGRLHRGCGKRVRYHSEGGQGQGQGQYYNTWYTSKELKLFRADIWLTINWMLLNGISGGDSDDDGDGTIPASATTIINNRHKQSSKGMSLRMLNQKYKHYPFCSKGIEGRTPIGRLIKQKRRKDAVRTVLSIQKGLRKKQEKQEHAGTKEEDEQQVEQRKQADVKALAFVYASHCRESCSSALHLGRDYAKEAAMIVMTETTIAEEEESRQEENNKKKKKKEMVLVSSNIVHYHSLCDDSDSYESGDSDANTDHSSDDDDDGSCSIRSDISSSSSSSSSYSVTISSIRNQSRSRPNRTRTTASPSITYEDTLFSSPFCNDYHYDYDIEDESEVEVELIESIFTSPCSSRSSSR